MRKRATVLMVMAVVVLSTVPAQAAPWEQQWLPDADLFCQHEGDFVAVGDWVGNPSAGTLWVAEGPFAGHYLIVTSAHYYAPEVLGQVAVSDEELAMLYPLGERTFGRKVGRDQRVACQVVSRFAGPDDESHEDDFTVYAPLVLARVR
jgi:hypothetical protein